MGDLYKTNEITTLHCCKMMLGFDTYHHEMAVLCPVDHRLLTTLEVHKPFSARLDIKSDTAHNNNSDGVNYDDMI